MSTIDAILADPAFPRLKDYVVQTTGLAWYADKDRSLAERIRRLLSRHPGADCAAYLAVLRQAPAAGPEMSALIGEVAVGETFFFRHAEQFAALAALALPDRLERNQRQRRLSVWSAACASGAEAHSVEILLKRTVADRLDGWRVGILGTDINRAFLDQAEAGTYSRWATRGLPADILRDCFDERDSRMDLKPGFREWTTFHRHNLVTGLWPPPQTPPEGFDIVLCRNVMIYFDAATRGRLLERLAATVAEDGWLLVGHAELGTVPETHFTPVAVAGSILHRKRAARWTAPVLAPSRTPSRAGAMAWRRRKPPADRLPPGPTLDDVAALADRGDWPAARARCEALLGQCPLNAAAHYLHGLILEHAGGDAVAALRRAVYLERGFALAHYHLGRLHWTAGRRDAARRHWRNARHAVAGLDDDAPVAQGHGLTIGELRSIIGRRLGGEPR